VSNEHDRIKQQAIRDVKESPSTIAVCAEPQRQIVACPQNQQLVAGLHMLCQEGQQSLVGACSDHLREYVEGSIQVRLEVWSS
jgi:hypothetical protein